MAHFRYKAINASGTQIQGHLEADSRDEAVAQLQDLGALPYAVESESIRVVDAGRGKRGAALNANELVHFTREMATMLGAGLAVNDSLATLSALQSKSEGRQLVDDVRKDVEAGNPLSESLARFRSVFPEIYTSSVHAGEESGSLGAAFVGLANYLERRREFASAVTSALVYPAVVCLVAGGAVLLLLLLVVPRFEPFFQDSDVALPWSAALVFAASETLRADGWWLLAGLVAVGALIARLLLNPSHRQRFDALVLATPILGSLVEKAEVARFSRTAGTLLSNGMPLLSTVRLSLGAVGNVVMRAALGCVGPDLERGGALAESMRASAMFPALAVQLVEVGEKTGTLAATFVKIADIYDREVERAVKKYLGLLEPALILVLGISVGFIVVSILLAILSLNELVI